MKCNTKAKAIDKDLLGPFQTDHAHPLHPRTGLVVNEALAYCGHTLLVHGWVLLLHIWQLFFFFLTPLC